jgi:hypothetical protein
MGKWLRRIRGAVGIGVTWGAACFVVGTLPRWVFGIDTDVPVIAPTFAAACAACASGSLALARRAVRRELPNTYGDSAEAELIGGEKRKAID